LASLGLPTILNSHADLEQIIPHIESAINNVRLWEYYVFDVQASVKAVAASLDSGSVKQWEGPSVIDRSADELAQTLKSEGVINNYRAYSGRFCSAVDADVAAGLIKANSPNEGTEALASKWGKVLDVLNVDLYAECNDDVKAAKEGILGRIKYTRLEAEGPKMGEITKQ
jgi:glycogen debranching enzyme